MWGSSLGSLGDLNSTFASLTNALSLDNLQKPEDKKEGSTVSTSQENDSSGNARKLETIREDVGDTEKESYEKKIQELETILELQKQENSILKEKFSTSENQNSSLSQNNRLTAADTSDFEFEISKLKQIVDVLNQENQSLRNEKLSLKSDNESLNSEKKQLEDKIKSTHTSSPKKGKDNIASSQDMSVNTDESQEFSCLSPKKGEVSSFSSSVSPFLSPLPSTPNLSSKESTMDNSTVESLQQQLQTSQEENKKLLKRITKWKVIEKDFQERLSSAENKSNELQSQLSSQMKDITSLQEEREALIRNEKERKEREEKHLQEMQDKVKELSQNCSLLSEEKEQWLEEKQHLVKEFQGFSSLQQADQEERDAEREDLREKVMSFETSLAKSEKEKEAVLSQNNIMISQLKEQLSQQEKDFQTRYQQLQEEKKQISDELSSKISFLSSSQQQEKEKESEKSSSILSELTKKEDTIKQLESKISNMTEKFKELMQKHVDMKNRNTSNEKLIENMKSEYEKTLQQKVLSLFGVFSFFFRIL
jgi:chromosome segregation ATPase